MKENRYIDRDAIPYLATTSEGDEKWVTFKSVVDKVPDADVVKVCRCAKCVYCDVLIGIMGGSTLYCTHWNKNTEEDAFCSYGFEVKKDD